MSVTVCAVPFQNWVRQCDPTPLDNVILTFSVENSLTFQPASAQVVEDHLKYITNTIDMLEHKVMRLGTGLQEYYCVCAIEGLLKQSIPTSTAATDQEVQIASEKVSQLWQRILGLQDNYSAAATLASLPNMVCLLLLHAELLV